MSTFLGLIEEIPHVSIDRFDGKNLSSKAFFLSHFHSDHMQGLRNKEFHTLLKNSDSIFLYCSELTALFLSYNHLQGLSGKIRVLPVGDKYIVNVDGLEECVSVTALSAGHCPGSIMFLMKYKSTKVLYTGDLRMARKDILKMQPLRTSEGGMVSIDALYLDTTFFHPSYSYLPSRDESMKEFLDMCRSWIKKDDKNIIDLRTPATIGVEYVLIKIFREFGEAVHVSDTAYEKYSRIPDLAPAITQNARNRFHACIAGHLPNKLGLFQRIHPGVSAKYVCSIKLCAMHARNLNKGQALVSFKKQQDLYRVVYSSHSSHDELKEMVELLQPEKVVPCVVPVEYSPEQVVGCLHPNSQLITLSSSEESNTNASLSPLRFSSYEEVADSDSESKPTSSKAEKNEVFSIAKYNADESSDDAWRDTSDEDELPPFRWDCFYDARRKLGFKQTDGPPKKRVKAECSVGQSKN